jgi:hypothetical protein
MMAGDAVPDAISVPANYTQQEFFIYLQWDHFYWSKPEQQSPGFFL